MDSHAARRITEALGDITNSVVLEIGAGRGALTRLLATPAGQLIATELDETLVSELREVFAAQRNTEIVHANFLCVSISELLSQTRPSAQRVKLVGNIPYYITSDILLHVLGQHDAIEIAVMMVQKEVADRLAAEPGTRDYGLLTVTTQLFAKVERLFTLPPSAFSPAPQVSSTVVRLKMESRAEKLGVDPPAFLEFCKLAFSQKRKTLVNNLRGRYEAQRIKQSVQATNVREDVRAEALSLEQLAGVYRRLMNCISAQ